MAIAAEGDFPCGGADGSGDAPDDTTGLVDDDEAAVGDIIAHKDNGRKTRLTAALHFASVLHAGPLWGLDIVSDNVKVQRKRHELAQQAAAPNDGPGTPLGNSDGSGGAVIGERNITRQAAIQA